MGKIHHQRDDVVFHEDSARQQNATSDLIGILKERSPGLALAAAVSQAAWPAAVWVRRELRGRRTFTVKVPGGSAGGDLYDSLHEWILARLPAASQKALVAYETKASRPVSYDDGGHRRRTQDSRVRLRYDGSREQVITIAGHRVKIQVADGSPATDKQLWKPPEIVFTVWSEAARDAILREISSVLESSRRRNRQPAFRILNNWDEWERTDDLPSRPLSSVFLPGGQLERLEADIRRFTESEADYVRRAVPWHRGHLYEGPPGTGKTSVARALACHFGLDMWYLPLGDIKKDTRLLKTVSTIKGQSVLLLEDVDVFHAATSRGDEVGGTTLSGLLNALDGVSTPHGLITIMTTNEPGVLDKALIRPGRVDVIEHFGLVGSSELLKLVRHWYGEIPSSFRSGLVMLPAQAAEICKQHDNADDAAREIEKQAHELDQRQA